MKKQIKNIRTHSVTIIIIAVVILINIVAFGLYISNINRDIEKQTEDHLADIMVEASARIELKIEESIHALGMTAFYISISEDYEQPEIYSNIKKMTAQAGFQNFDIINSDGIGLEINGSMDYSEDKIYQKTAEKQVVIKDVKNADGKVEKICFSIPIQDENEVFEGAYLVSCTQDEFAKILELDSVSSNGKAFIVKRDGTILSQESGSSIQTLDDILKDNPSAVKKLKSYMKSKKSGVLGFENGIISKRYICYSRTNYSDWEILMVISSNDVKANISDVTDDFIFLGVIIALMLLMLIGFFIHVLVQAQSKNAMNLRRYYMVSRYIDDIIIDYSCTKDTLYCNENWEKLFGYELPAEHVKENVDCFIAEEDREKFRSVVEKLRVSEEIQSFSCRILNRDKEPVECILKLFGVKEKKDTLMKIVGVIEKRV